MEYRAALFASHGLASMTLAYFGHENLPGPPKRINVGDSYFKVRLFLPSKFLIIQQKIACRGHKTGCIKAAKSIFFPHILYISAIIIVVCAGHTHFCLFHRNSNQMCCVCPRQRGRFCVIIHRCVRTALPSVGFHLGFS